MSKSSHEIDEFLLNYNTLFWDYFLLGHGISVWVYNAQLRREREAVEQSKKEAIARRRDLLLQRQAENIDNRRHLGCLKHFQHTLTTPWVFSYGVMWPRETYAKYRR